MNSICITGTGSCVPEKILTNEDLSKIVDTSDEWITTRTGIKERRIVDKDKATSDLASEAARKALQAAKISPEEIDLIVLGTTTPDHLFPSTACLVQKAIGAKNAAAFDISAACSGFTYALTIAQSLLASGGFQKALVITADVLSKFTDWSDRSTCVLFGDGAGALVLENKEGNQSLPKILAHDLGSDGSQAEILKIPGGGSRHPGSTADDKDHPPFIQMDGNEVYKNAVTKMIATAKRSLAKAGKTAKDVSLLIPHQANLRIIQSIAKRMGLPPEKVYLNIHKYGNMSGATIIVALDEAVREGRIKSGDIVELIAFGAGFTWGSILFQW